MNVPAELRYSSDHEWAKVDGTKVRIGITDYAQDSLGDVVFVQLPEVGQSVDGGGPLGEIESTKSVSEFYSPVAGSVSEVNLVLEDTPELVNSDPYGEGWMVVIDATDPSAVSDLLDADGYSALIEG